MILLRTGSVGEGKSYNTIAECVDHIRQGGVVATNFGLSKGWAERVVRSKFLDFLDKDARTTRAKETWSRWFQIGTVESVIELSKQLPDLVSGYQKKRLQFHRRTREGIPEGLGLLILDEGHIYFNSRNWKDNLPMITFLSQSRKKGWHVVIIAHHEDMIDNQIRSGLINQTEAMRNLADVCPIPFVPFKIGYLTFGKPIFLGIRKLSGAGGGKGMVVSRPLRVLNTVVSSLYETMEEFCFTDQLTVAKRIGCPPALRVGMRSPSNPLLRDTLKEMVLPLAGMIERSD